LETLRVLAGCCNLNLCGDMVTYKIPKLTKTEIQSLQVDAVLRQMGELTDVLIDINAELGFAISKLGKARVEVEKLKSDKQTVVELMRALKVMVQSA